MYILNTKKKKVITLYIFIVLSLVSISCVFAQSSGNYMMHSCVCDQGGCLSTSGSYTVLDAAGQPSPVGMMTSSGYSLSSGFCFTGTVATGITVETSGDAVPPAECRLMQNYPNPFNPRTTIEFFLPRKAEVKLTVYDLQGRMVSRLADDDRREGRHTVTWNGRDLHGRTVASGMYIYRLTVHPEAAGSNRIIRIRKMIFMK